MPEGSLLDGPDAWFVPRDRQVAGQTQYDTRLVFHLIFLEMIRAITGLTFGCFGPPCIIYHKTLPLASGEPLGASPFTVAPSLASSEHFNSAASMAAV